MANESQRLWNLLANRLTATRAGYLDELDFGLDERLGTPADTDLATDIANVKTVVDETNGYLEAGGAIYDAVVAHAAGVDIAADIIAIKSEIDNATYGLSALETLVDGIETSQAKMLFSMDFWSDVVEEIVVTGAQATPAITGGNVVVADLPGTATIVRAIVMMKFRMVENTNAAENSLDAAAALPMQIDDSGNTGWLSCIDFVDEMCKIAAETREGGDVIIGDIDVAARVDGNDTYDFQWLNAKAHLANIQFNDVQMGIRIWYSI